MFQQQGQQQGQEQWQQGQQLQQVTCFTPGPNQPVVPPYQNTDRIVTLNLNEACSCGSSHPDARSDIVPNELMSHAVQLTSEDYRTIMNILKAQGYVRWRSCYSSCSAGLLFCSIIVIAVSLILTGFVASPSDSFDLAFVIPGFLLLGLAMLLLTCRYMMCFKTATKFTNVIQAVHTIACRYNLMVGYKYVVNCCDDERMEFTFYFYDWRPCQAHLQAVLDAIQRRDQLPVQPLGQVPMNASVQRIISESRQSVTTSNPGNVDAWTMLLRHSTEYVQLLVENKLRVPSVQRHARQGECLCQFVESFFLGAEENGCCRLTSVFGGKSRDPWDRINNF